MIPGPHKALVIFIDQTDIWNEEPLYDAIVKTLARVGIVGATASVGLMGYGTHRHIHRKGLFGVSDDKPVIITAVDSEEKIRAALPSVVPMVKEGLVMIQDAEVISTGTASAATVRNS